MKLDEAVDGFAGFGIKAFVLLGLQEAAMVEAIGEKAAVLVVDPGEAAGHAGAEVDASGSEDDCEAAGHVFAAVIADAFDDGRAPELRTAKRSPARPAAKNESAGGAVESDVAEDDVWLGCRCARAGREPHHQLAAAETFADEVVGQAFEHELSCRRREGAEGLARRRRQLEDGDEAGSSRGLARISAISPARRAPKGAIFVARPRLRGRTACLLRMRRRARLHPCVIHRCVRSGRMLRSSLPSAGGHRRAAQAVVQVELAVEADLLKQIGAADGRSSEGRPSSASMTLQVSGELLEETDKVFGLATELGAQLGLLRGDAGGTGVEMTLARHVATERDEHRGAEGELVGAEQRGDDDVTCRAQAAIGAQAHAAAQAVLDEHLLRFSDAQLPGIAGVLDAGERRCAGASGVAGDDDVVGIGLGDAGGDGSDSAARRPA